MAYYILPRYVLDTHTLPIISFYVFYIKDITTSVIASIDEMASPHLCRRNAPIPIYRYLKYLRRYLRVTNHSHVRLLSHLSKCSMQLLQGAINWRQGAVHQRPWNGPSLSINSWKSCCRCCSREISSFSLRMRCLRKMAVSSAWKSSSNCSRHR